MFTEKTLKANQEKAKKLTEKLEKGNLRAYVYFNPSKDSRLTVAYRYPKDGAGKQEALVTFVEKSVRYSYYSYYGYATGYGYDKNTASIQEPFKALQFNHGMFEGLTIDEGRDPKRLLEAEGFVLVDVVG